MPKIKTTITVVTPGAARSHVADVEAESHKQAAVDTLSLIKNALAGTDTPIAVEPGQLLLTLRGILADVRAHNGNLNDPEGNGSGDNAQSPTGDDYNYLLELLGPLYALTGEAAP